MERVVERNEFMLLARGLKGAADLAGELDRSFVGFGSRVGNEHLRCVTHSTGVDSGLDQELAEGTGPVIVVQVRGVDEGLSLGHSSISNEKQRLATV